MASKICIAGKNNIAIAITKYILANFQDTEPIAIFNKNDLGINGFQRSYKQYCKYNNIRETTLEEIYSEQNITFLSLEFDKIINPNRFKTNQLFNIHFSLLPEYKGMYTSALPIIHGKSYSGVTLHKIDKGIDTGDVIDQFKFSIEPNLKAEELYHLYIQYGIAIVEKNLGGILSGNYSSFPQGSKNSSYYSKREIDYAAISIDLKMTAFQIQKQINAFVFPSYQLPIISGYPIYNSEILPVKSEGKAGEVLADQSFYLDVNTIDYNIRLYKDLRESLSKIAMKGSISELENYISNGYVIEQRTKEGWDIAIIAAYHDQFNFLEFLLDDLSWNVNIKNYNGTTLAMYLMTKACMNNNTTYLKRFIEKYKIDLEIKDYFGNNIFNYARKYNNESVVHLLEKYR